MKVKMKIPTLEEYKKMNEDFFNPFDEKDLDKEVKPKHISDRSGPLIPRKETFNLARIEYSKRPNGEYTIIAKTQFAKGEIVEMCPTIILKEDAKVVEKLKDIIFEIDKDKGEWALVFGYGSLYHHADQPNVDYAYNRLTRQMYFITRKPVKLGEELTINYGKNYWQERISINTIADLEEKPKMSGKVVTKDKNESMVQPNSEDLKNTDNIRTLSSPRNPANPVISGVAIVGQGQS
jgi:hypothetical protein